MENNNIIIPKNVIRRKNKTKRSEIPTNIFAGSENSIPDKIFVYYKDDINLDIIDKAIKHRFLKLKEGIYNIRADIELLKNEKIETTTYASKHYYERKIQEKLTFMDSIKNDHQLNKYITETEYLIKSYKVNKDINIAEVYLNLANKYIKIEKIKQVKNNLTCRACDYELGNLIEERDGFFICPECNMLNNSLKPNKYVRDLENYNRNHEEDINNFIKIIDKFEGKNTLPIHEDLYKELDDYFIEREMRKGEYYRKLPYLENGKKKGTSRKLLWSALEKIGYNKYYDETSYIAHIYWGWKIPDLTLYRDQIIKDYQITQQIWNDIKKDYNRSASLGTQYRLYVHLLSVDYPYCDRDDFKIQDMVESLRLHNHAWERMCKEAKIKFYSV